MLLKVGVLDLYCETRRLYAGGKPPLALVVAVVVLAGDFRKCEILSAHIVIDAVVSADESVMAK